MRLLLFFGLVMGTVEQAESCTRGPPMWGIGDGDVLPSHGVAYAQDNGWLRHAGVEVVSHDVHRATWASADDASLEHLVTARRVRFSDAWVRPVGEPTIRRMWFEWSSFVFELDQRATAIRVEWLVGEQRFVRYLVERRDDRTGRAMFVLSPDDCWETFDPRVLEEGARLTLTAIRVDGSEAPVRGLPDWLAPRRPPPPQLIAGEPIDPPPPDASRMVVEMIGIVTLQRAWM